MKINPWRPYLKREVDKMKARAQKYAQGCQKDAKLSSSGCLLVTLGLQKMTLGDPWVTLGDLGAPLGHPWAHFSPLGATRGGTQEQKVAKKWGANKKP